MATEHPERIGQYDVLGLIGKGGMGRVYKAVQPSLNRVVAIKVLPPEFLEDEERVERFNREAQAIALLNHPNVVQIIEKDQEDDHIYFVMEYVPGTSLAAILKQRRLSLPEAFRVFRGVCKGLEAAHQQTIIHRDLSPRNILVSEDLSTVKLVDFGISRIETVSREQGTLSTSEFSLGSLHYMAPEQARNMVSADHRADIYSLGVLLYEMLTGRVPIGRFNLPSQLNSEVPPEVDPIVLRCLEAEPQDRYPTVGRLLTEMGRLEDQLRLGLVHEVRGIGSSTSKILLKSTGSRTLRIAALAAAAIALIGAAVFLGRDIIGQAAPEGEPVEIVQHERVELPETELDPLAAALAGVEAPEPEELGEPGEDSQAVTEPAPRKPAPPARISGSTPPPGTAPTASAPPPSLAQDLEVARNKLEAGLHAEARLDLEKLIADNPTASVTPQAYLVLGLAHEREDNVDKARAAYVELRSRFPGSSEAAESLYRSAGLLRAEGGRDQLRSARALLTDLADRHPDSSWAPRALIDRAAIEIEARWAVQDPVLRAQVPAALVTYRDLVARYPQHAGVEDALWNLGDMYFELKEFDRSAQAFEDLGRRFPSTGHDAWWRAGQVYDRRLDQPEKAIAAYRMVPKSSKRYDDAQKRISRLGR